MASTAIPSDPIRAQVERRLTEIADMFVVRPCEQLTRLASFAGAPCRLARARLAEPFAVLRSIAELAFGPGPGAAPPPAVATPAVPVPAGSPDDAQDAAPDAPSPGELPIAEYESLAASQVVARLDDLTADELQRVRAFEAAHRGRRTVLGKIDQLLAAR